MIPPTSSSQRATAPALLKPAGAAAGRTLPPSDRISADQADFLRAELQRQPEARSEMITRGRELVADPAYPSPEIVREVARRLLAGPALAEDQPR